MKTFTTFKKELLEKRILDVKVKKVNQGNLSAAVKFAKITAKKLPKNKKQDAIDLAVRNFDVDKKKLELALKESPDFSSGLEDAIIDIFKMNNNKLTQSGVDKKILSNRKLVKLAGDTTELKDFFDELLGDLIIQKGKNFLYMG